ncbi:MAG: hypothetical protein ABL931_22010, partial [Usitatibacteraceae bacterium]
MRFASLVHRYSIAVRTASAALLCFAFNSHGAALTVKSIRYHGDMPYVHSDNASLAQRINNAMYLE